MKIVGLMSGTSGDGVDAALVEITGSPPQLSVDLLAFTCLAFDDQQRQRIFALFDPETGTVDRICEMNFVIGEWFAKAAIRVIEEAGVAVGDVSLIGSHGQTIYHAVDDATTIRSTLQIGAAAIIAARTGITTVSDFRVADVAAGGHGAPLVSYVDWLLLRHPTLSRAVQNIGGIANVTYLPPGADPSHVIAFDTGPGNMLIDYIVQRATGGRLLFDRDGALAAQGQTDERFLAELMAHPFVGLQPPKTTGREQFGVAFGGSVWDRARELGLSPTDAVATVTAFTASSIEDAYRRLLPRMPDEVVLGGGGANNDTLVAMLQRQLSPARVTTHEEFGLSGDGKEALAFAILAYETIQGRPGNLPNCTGAHHRVVLGNITPGSNYQRLLKLITGEP